LIPLSLVPAIVFGMFLAVIGFGAMYLEYRDKHPNQPLGKTIKGFLSFALLFRDRQP
jgi:hypothetical protein